MGECLRQHEAKRDTDPPTSPPTLSRQSTLPPPPRSMLPTPLPQEGRGSLEPCSLQLPDSQMSTEPVATQRIHLQSQSSENPPVMNMNPTQFGNVPPWLSSSCGKNGNMTVSVDHREQPCDVTDIEHKQNGAAHCPNTSWIFLKT